MRTFDYNLKIERKRRPFFDTLYEDMGLEIVDRDQNKFWDLRLKRDDCIFTVEEKAREQTWDDIYVEIVQDTNTNSPGWIYYCKADRLVYGMFGDPIKVYWIKLKEFQVWFEGHEQFYGIGPPSKEGWGHTLNKPIPITHIPNSIIKLIYPM